MEEYMIKVTKKIEFLANEHLELQKWGFKATFRLNESRIVSTPLVIYSSTWCKLKISFHGWEPPFQHQQFTLSVDYGRLHAPDDNYILNWEGKDCFCWHGLISREVLNFLDGLTPQEAVSQKGFPKVIEDFRASELWQTMTGTRRGPELTIRMNASIWEHYGVHLFELFDLRHPELWERYSMFLKEYYDLKGRSANIKPSLDKVC